MIISEKQIMQLMQAAKLAVEDNLSEYGKKQTNALLDIIMNQQSDELKEIE